MSRREDRGSDLKRHRSRFDREHSPKRSRRDGKPETERPHTDHVLDKDRLDRDQHRRRLQDVVPLESVSRQDAKIEAGTVSKDSEKKTIENEQAVKHLSDPAKEPRSRSYFQHDDRDSTRQNGRSFSRRTDGERGWWRDPKEQQNQRVENKMIASDGRDEKTKDNREDNHVWRHDAYFQMETNPKQPARKRPSFREQKITAADPEKSNKPEADHAIPNPPDHAAKSGRRDERVHNSRHYDKTERPFAQERDLNKDGTWRGNFSSRESRYRGREQFTTRQGYRPTWGHVEKWKHDLYNEANRSPSPKNDEDQISKIEALLAS